MSNALLPPSITSVRTFSHGHLRDTSLFFLLSVNLADYLIQCLALLFKFMQRYF